MSLSVKLALYFESRVRERGAEYHKARRVRLKTCRYQLAEAIVRDTSDFEVVLEREDETLRVSCTCPSSLAGELCKHLWAALLAAEAKGGLRWNGGRSPRRLLLDGREIEPLAGAIPEPPEERGGEASGPSSAEEPGLFPDRTRSSKPQQRRAAGPGGASPPATESSAASLARRKGKTWKADPILAYLDGRLGQAGRAAVASPKRLLAGQIRYSLDLAATERSQFLTLRIEIAPKLRDGSWEELRPVEITQPEIRDLRNREDREVFSLIAAALPGRSSSSRSELFPALLRSHCELPHKAVLPLLPLLCATGRFRLRRGAGTAGSFVDSEALAWEGGEPWEVGLEVREGEEGGFELGGSFRRKEERLPLTAPDLVLRAGFLIAGGRVCRLEAAGQFSWISRLREKGPLRFSEEEELFRRLFAGAELPRVDLPESLRCEEVRLPPRPRLRLFAPRPSEDVPDLRWPTAALAFLYGERGEREVPAGAAGSAVYQREERRLWVRDLELERGCPSLLQELGFRRGALDADTDTRPYEIAPGRIPAAIRALLAEGWSVEAEGKLQRAPGRFQMGVSSGVDWFELRGEADFEGQAVSLPELLAAVRRGETFVVLGDGSLGVLPETWLRRIAPLLRAGEAVDDHLRFAPAQAALLDAWLAELPEASFDAAFERARERLRTFEGIAEAPAPEGFRGTLRPYQRIGLGWLVYLREFAFGGCLADDMGLGKTVQVLALLEGRRAEREAEGLPPSLLVVPRSLVFNWQTEAERFAPRLRLLDHTGAARAKGEGEGDPFAACDVVLTTYGTLRRDVERLRLRDFDYLILDEAQAIKNADSQTAKAARLLRGRHRLALSGTPVENHLGELWTLLDFLNPGLLGSGALAQARSTELRDPDPETRALLARALRPFLLRRTKEAVAPELPAKVEQTLVCDLPSEQRRLYDELRDHYRANLDSRIARQGMGRAKILVLEALLRLRQAACHPGLIDPERGEERSAKLDLLVPQLREIAAEGHKALVFSQFTRFLGLLRGQLEREGLPYLYLDGKTRDRQAQVERFQSDPESRLFLISLKAGGLGLNLTGADYVYLLDPWWNPAIEAQAIDRAHRLGQSRTVFATRLVARDTVEEKILELQARKRALADAVIKEDGSLLAGLGREDLELLLS